MRPGGLVLGLLLLALSGCGLEAEREPGPALTRALQCSTDLIESGEIDYVADAPGAQGAPVEVVQEWLGESLEGTDELVVAEDAARPGRTTDSVGVIREGSRIALVHLAPASDGGWLVSAYDGCAGTLEFP